MQPYLVTRKRVTESSGPIKGPEQYIEGAGKWFIILLWTQPYWQLFIIYQYFHQTKFYNQTTNTLFKRMKLRYVWHQIHRYYELGELICSHLPSEHCNTGMLASLLIEIFLYIILIIFYKGDHITIRIMEYEFGSSSLSILRMYIYWNHFTANYYESRGLKS